MLQDLRLGGGNQTGKTDAVFAGLGAFNASSGVMYTNGDEIQRAHWVVAELQQAGPEPAIYLRLLRENRARRGSSGSGSRYLHIVAGVDGAPHQGQINLSRRM